MRKPKIEIQYGGIDSRYHDQFYWRLVGVNGEIVCHSEMYASLSNAVRAAKRARILMQKAEIVK